jgi:hypothetical protein
MKARKENVGFGHSVAKMVPLVIGLRYFIDLTCYVYFLLKPINGYLHAKST